ncbi:MAG: Tn3 family transposase, partial [Rubrivivax sp.]
CRLKSTAQTGLRRPIARPTETPCPTSTWQWPENEPRANPRDPGRLEPSLFAPKSKGPHSGRVGPAQARRADEMQAVADALSLLANIVMAWNTAQMQAVLNRWANRRQVIAPELIGRIAPTRLEGINLRGVFRFPIERYADQLLLSQTASRTSAAG